MHYFDHLIRALVEETRYKIHRVPTCRQSDLRNSRVVRVFLKLHDKIVCICCRKIGSGSKLVLAVVVNMPAQKERGTWMF